MRCVRPCVMSVRFCTVELTFLRQNWRFNYRPRHSLWPINRRAPLFHAAQYGDDIIRREFDLDENCRSWECESNQQPSEQLRSMSIKTSASAKMAAAGRLSCRRKRIKNTDRQCSQLKIALKVHIAETDSVVSVSTSSTCALVWIRKCSRSLKHCGIADRELIETDC